MEYEAPATCAGPIISGSVMFRGYSFRSGAPAANADARYDVPGCAGGARQRGVARRPDLDEGLALAGPFRL